MKILLDGDYVLTLADFKKPKKNLNPKTCVFHYCLSYTNGSKFELAMGVELPTNLVITFSVIIFGKTRTFKLDLQRWFLLDRPVVIFRFINNWVVDCPAA